MLIRFAGFVWVVVLSFGFSIRFVVVGLVRDRFIFLYKLIFKRFGFVLLSSFRLNGIGWGFVSVSKGKTAAAYISKR